VLGHCPADLVGSSFGGQLAVDFALRHRAPVAGLLLVEPRLDCAEMSDGRRARMACQAAARERGGDAFADAWLGDRHLAGSAARRRRLVRTMLRDNVGLFRSPSSPVPLPLRRHGSVALPPLTKSSSASATTRTTVRSHASHARRADAAIQLASQAPVIFAMLEHEAWHRGHSGCSSKGL
jgi:pimeloyl-ACP methyl ester carboxylesterase